MNYPLSKTNGITVAYFKWVTDLLSIGIPTKFYPQSIPTKGPTTRTHKNTHSTLILSGLEQSKTAKIKTDLIQQKTPQHRIFGICSVFIGLGCLKQSTARRGIENSHCPPNPLIYAI